MLILFVRSADRPAAAITPIQLLKSSSARELLESSARLAQVEDFGLQLAKGRRMANLGPISIVLREEPTARQAPDTLSRYLRLLNASLLTRIEDHGEVVLIREEILMDGALPLRQSVELAVGGGAAPPTRWRSTWPWTAARCTGICRPAARRFHR